jgi:hypothetical protein
MVRHLQELCQFLARGKVATYGASILLAVGLTVIFSASFTIGLLVIVVAALWGSAAWLVSPELQKRKPQPTTSQKPKKIEQYQIAYRRYQVWKWSIPSLIALVPVGFLIGHLWPQGKLIPPTPVNPATLTALYIGCGWDHIPITIQPGTSIHVMWLDPSILKGNPNIPFLGPFEDIAAPTGGGSLKWPTDREGRWMNSREIEEAMKATKTIASPYAFRCTLNNYAVTLDEITAELIVDTSDGKRHTYDVHFNPSVLGHPFDFYMVNRCSSGTVPDAAQWGDAATVRILGEVDRRRIPLQFERRAFPSNLMVGFGASWFIWNDRKNGCSWDN